MLAQSVIPIPWNPSIYPFSPNITLVYGSIPRYACARPPLTLECLHSVVYPPIHPDVRPFGCMLACIYLCISRSLCWSFYSYALWYLQPDETFVSMWSYVIAFRVIQSFNVVNAVDYAALVCLPGCRRRRCRRGIRVNGNAENENFPCSWS